MLKTGVSPFCSDFLQVCSLPNSSTRSCFLLSGALYCFIASTGYATFLPFVLQPLSTKSGPRVIGDRCLTMISPYYWQTLPRSNELPPRYKSRSLCFSISSLDTLRVCVQCYRKKTSTWCVQNPQTRPESRTMPTQASCCWSLCKDPSPHMIPQVKWLKHSQKGGSHLSCNTWKHSFFNTAVHPTRIQGWIMPPETIYITPCWSKANTT